jgi:alanine-synthesizing transaminase
MIWEHDNSIGNLYSLKRKALIDGIDLIDLSMINPDIIPQTAIVDRLVEAINRGGSHRYSSSRGIRKLREAFVERYSRVFDISLDAETDVCVTLGAKDGILNALLAIKSLLASQSLLANSLNSSGNQITSFLPSSHVMAPLVLVGAPTYPAYKFVADYLGLSLATFEISPDEDAMLSDIDRIAHAVQAPILLLNFPNNPTGITVSQSFYEGLAEIILRRSLYVVNDFTYGEMVYSGQGAQSLLSMGKIDKRVSDYIVEAYSLSKSFSVPGWRVGGVLGSRMIVQEAARLKSRVDFGVFLPVQVAAAGALQNDRTSVSITTDIYNRRYSFLKRELEKSGWSVGAAEAGCCLWAKVPESSHFLKHKGRVAEALLMQGVATLPGRAFGTEYEDYLRFALVAPEERLREVVLRVERLSAELSE